MLENHMTFDDELLNKPLFECKECGEKIFEGDYYYVFDNVIICEQCVGDHKIEAERDDLLA